MKLPRSREKHDVIPGLMECEQRIIHDGANTAWRLPRWRVWRRHFRSAAIGGGGFRSAAIGSGAFTAHGFRGAGFHPGFHHHGRRFAFGAFALGVGYPYAYYDDYYPYYDYA